MRSALVTLLVLAAVSAAAAQTPLTTFEDVPPWHWAYDAVQDLAQKGILQGYPRSDRDLALNAVTQVYDSFVHSQHAAARRWAESFLTNLPANWPRPLEHSTLVAFRFTETQVLLTASRGTVTASVSAQTRVSPGAPATALRAHLRAVVTKDSGGRWRVDYQSLVAAQPDIFR
jgi:hypothetical protein